MRDGKKKRRERIEEREKNCLQTRTVKSPFEVVPAIFKI
jgi:hypothetical protein